jgi:hypothetical protein
MCDLSDDEVEELRAAAEFMRAGGMGEFAARIGEAALYADRKNLDKLSGCFADLFRLAWALINR